MLLRKINLSRINLGHLGRIRVHTREDGKRIMVSKRRDMSHGVSAPGVASFTKAANARALASRRAKNKVARKSRQRNRV